MLRTLVATLFTALAAVTALANDATKVKSPTVPFQGTWLFDEASLKKSSELLRVWESVITVKGDTFTLTKIMGTKNDLKGTLIFDPKNPTWVDLKTAELDLSDLLPGFGLPASTLSGLYKFDGERLTLCFARDSKCKRPTAFVSSGDAYLVTLVRTPNDFKEFPKEIKLTVLRPDGKPATGVLVSSFMNRSDEPSVKDAKPVWALNKAEKTDATGAVTLKSETINGQIIVRDSDNGMMAIVPVSPAKRASGQFRAKLKPEVRITGSYTCDELTKADHPIDWVNMYLISNGSRFVYNASKHGEFEFIAPPGKYTLFLYGTNLNSKTIDIVVPEDRSEFNLEPIPLTAAAFALLKGKAAPELEGVMGWKGEKTTLASLKGKYVLLEFWGYWCGPCVASMPVLIELHEKYADKGLVIIGIHRDADGEVNTAAKLDAKLAHFKKELWKGKDIPFPVALVAGTLVGNGDDVKPGGTIAKYGVQSYPSTILIDREGKVVGKFSARDIRVAASAIDMLLKEKK